MEQRIYSHEEWQVAVPLLIIVGYWFSLTLYIYIGGMIAMMEMI